MSAASERGTGAATASEPVALAFATDAASEQALRDGLSGHGEAQVWPGGVDAAVSALGGGAGARLLFVDLDGLDYPAGAIHELAAVCEVGTVVVAFGTATSARYSREVLLAGVSDYLVKPLEAGAVREAALRAGVGGADSAARVAAFAGGGGSGATTLAAGVAVSAAARGRYVSVLDLSRPYSALAFLLDVEPAAGLEELMEAAAHGEPETATVEAVCARREERIAVYAYRFGGALPAAPGAEALRRVLGALRRRGHLVVVDGLEREAMRQAVFGQAEGAVVVAEPTPGGAARALRLLARCTAEGCAPVVVRNHTRAFDEAQSARALRRAGLRRRPAVSVPFEPAVPALSDRGWPRGQVPRTLAAPLEKLTAAALGAPPPRGSEPAQARRRRRSLFARRPAAAR